MVLDDQDVPEYHDDDDDDGNTDGKYLCSWCLRGFVFGHIPAVGPNCRWLHLASASQLVQACP